VKTIYQAAKKNDDIFIIERKLFIQNQREKEKNTEIVILAILWILFTGFLLTL